MGAAVNGGKSGQGTVHPVGVFLQFALFPGCPEADARSAVEKAARNPQFYIDLDKCQYAASYEGTQALIQVLRK